MYLKQILNMTSAALSAAALSLSATGCISINSELGRNLIPEAQLFDVYVDTLYLDDIRMESLDSLSGYSTLRMTFGALRDDDFGLTTRSCALTLVPIYDTLDFGTNPMVKSFHFNAISDTASCISSKDLHIIQNIKVHDLEEVPGIRKDSVWVDLVYSNDLKRKDFINLPTISSGTPAYNGGDSLGFNFTKAFAQKYVDKMLAASTDNVYIIDTISNFISMLPGIIISTDIPAGNGGRINMFDISIYTSDNYVQGNYAELKFSSTYDGEQKDTSFIFLYGPASKISYSESSTDMPTQYAFNIIEHESLESGNIINPGKSLHIEGGTGLKPVLSAKEIHDKLIAKFAKRGVNKVDKVIINRSTILLPFEMPQDYSSLELYPSILNPTCKIKDEDTGKYSYASITDATVSSEDEGNINRSLLHYAPDISFHTQEILCLDEDATFSNYDLWMMIMKDETYKTTSSTSSSSSTSDYYNYLMMMQYYNSMYGGYSGYGYGSYSGYGYGSYGGYGYNNYYNYYLYNMLYNQSSSSSSSSGSTATQIDLDRYYNAVLSGPEANGARPRIVVVYSVPETAK